ncbi:MAG TPA: ABC transporter permease, partial [Opitutales bacterium]|nr:ABC transporter permease [Opitutales bacterium]
MKKFLGELGRFRFEFYESVRIAIEQVLQHKMRAALTALGVMIGVLAVTLMGTAVNGIDKGFNDSLSKLGRDVYYVGRWPWGHVGSDWRVYAARPRFRAEYAQKANEIIAETPNSTLDMAVVRNERHRTVRYGSNSIEGTAVIGTTSGFMQVSSMELSEGRFFSDIESDSGSRVIVLGADVANALFPGASPMDQSVIIGNQPYKVIGVFERQGDFMGLFSMDGVAAVPDKSMPTGRWDHHDVDIMIKVREGVSMEAARSEIAGMMRRIRSLMPEDYDDFEINSTEIIEKELGPVKKGVTLA